MERRLRTFETNFPEHPAIVAWAEFFGTVRNGVHASLCAGREWRDVAVEDWRGSGLSAKQFEHAGKAAIAARDAVVEGAAINVSTLRLKIKAQERKLAGREKDDDRLSALIAKLEAKRQRACAKVRSARERISTTRKASAIDRLKATIGAAKAVAAEASVAMKKASDERGKVRRALHNGKRRLGVLNESLAKAEKLATTEKPGLCFGSRKLLAAKSRLKENGFGSAEAWRTEWNRVRTRNLLVEGAAKAEGGNEFVRATIADDGSVSLEIRLPPGLDAFAEERIRVSGSELRIVRIHGLRFNHGHEAMLEAIRAANAPRSDRGTLGEGSAPISWRFIELDGGRGWRVHGSIRQAMPKKTSDPSKGRMAVDLNEHHVACAVVSPTGDLKRSWNVPLNLYGLSSGKRLARIRDVCAELARIADELGLPLSWERLDFSAKKAALTERDGPKRARMLSSFSYSAFDAALESACARRGVSTSRVNPAYTSVAGRVMDQARLGISIHEAAAFRIARRAMDLSERAPRPAGFILPDGARVTLLPLAKTGRRHEWAAWSKISKGIKAVLAARARAERSEKARMRERLRAVPIPAPPMAKSPSSAGGRNSLPEAGPEAGPAPVRKDGVGLSHKLHHSTR